MEDWAAELMRDRSEAAWDLFLSRYRRLMFAAIHRYAHDHDEVMELFTHVIGALRDDDFRRLRGYLAESEHRASFSTWLVTVIRHLVVDWFRSRDGRRRISALAARLPTLQRRIFELVFLQRVGHVTAFEQLRSSGEPDLTFHRFVAELRATYRAAAAQRHGGLLRELAPSEAALELPAEEEADPRELGKLLQEALGTLSPEDRVAIELYVMEGMPAERVARITGMSGAKAVYNRVYRLLPVLREFLERVGVARER